ncbi:hypothetical protein LP52_05600 [Streptomonospora alba]|uniref:Uncharacterized protein n=1 Tax=Streptomonospora alba TaxID=183763 RepID=A0A0C2JSB0_9ACTN|nr:hypothetical protein [Streptomonospora alba]KIH99707.1 hypothetical protein LP52_05600 [Streptomonospora alba]
MIGRWTVWVALLCAAIAGSLGVMSWNTDGWSFGTITWGVVCLAMLDAAWVFRRMSRKRRRAQGAADPSDAAESPRDGGTE